VALDLVDMLTYPQVVESRSAALLAELGGLLELVGLAGLAVREGWDAPTRWEAKLSLGQQQALGLARLLYTRPRSVAARRPTHCPTPALRAERRTHQAGDPRRVPLRGLRRVAVRHLLGVLADLRLRLRLSVRLCYCDA
jgi:hypothetical protein